MNPPRATNPAICFEAVTKDYVTDWRGRRWRALHEVSFSVGRGSICALVGPNGSGNSTALKIAAGLTRPDAGACVRDPNFTCCGYLAEQGALPDWQTAREALVTLARISGATPAVATERADGVLARTQLHDSATRRVREFSKGMRQRLALAQALLDQPQLLVLDEPAAGLDPQGLRVLARILGEERARGATILLSSHFLAQVENLCDQCVLLLQGRVAFAADASEVTRRGGMDRVYLETIGA